MKIVINDSGYGMEHWTILLPQYVCKILCDENSGYHGPIADHIESYKIGTQTRYRVGYDILDEELRTDRSLITFVEDFKPVELKIIDIPDDATDWTVVKDNVKDREEVFYVIDGQIFIDG